MYSATKHSTALSNPLGWFVYQILFSFEINHHFANIAEKVIINFVPHIVEMERLVASNEVIED